MTVGCDSELRGLRRVGQLVRSILDALERRVEPGVTTAELDAVAEDVMRRHGARSAPRLVYSFPGATCLSVNDEIVHGVPGPYRLQPGDLLKLDVTVEWGGFVADAARTVIVPGTGALDAVRGELGRALIDCAESAFRAAMGAIRVGARVRDIGSVVEESVTESGFSVIPELRGHGVGRSIHEEPTIPNFYDHEARQRLQAGMVLAVEPIICAGSGEVFTASDGWTVKTADGSLAAHYEHTILVSEDGPVLLTAA